MGSGRKGSEAIRSELLALGENTEKEGDHMVSESLPGDRAVGTM